MESEEAELKQSEQEWYDYWRVLFPTVTVDKIKKFQGEYQGSEEEKGDVLKAYEGGQGKMSEVIDNVMLATDEDEGRFREIIEAAIAAKEVKRLKGFKVDVQKDAKRKKRAEKVRMKGGGGVENFGSKKSEEGYSFHFIFGKGIKSYKSRIVRGPSTSLSARLLPCSTASRCRRQINQIVAFVSVFAQSLLLSPPPSFPPFPPPNPQEAKDAEELLRAIQAKRGVNALATMATDRKNQMSSFYDSLKEKYGKEGGDGGGGGGKSGGKGKGKKRKGKMEEEEREEEEDIDDEEFERIRASLGKKKTVAAEGKGRE